MYRKPPKQQTWKSRETYPFKLQYAVILSFAAYEMQPATYITVDP
jgi:hypothetical protein